MNKPARHSYDVVVVGGSPTGVAAAVAASRAGARTLLMERLGFLGGQMTAGLMMTIHRPFWDAHGERIVGGIAPEILSRAIDYCGTKEPRRAVEREGDAFWSDSWVATALDPEVTKRLLEDMVIEEGIDMVFEGSIGRVEMSGRDLTAVSAEGRWGRTTIEAGCVVDATGDAHVAYLAGAPFDLRPNAFVPNLVGEVVGLNLRRFAEYVDVHYDELAPHPSGIGRDAFVTRIRRGKVFGVIGFGFLAGLAEEEGLVLEGTARFGFLHVGSGRCMLWRNNLPRVDALDPFSLGRAYLAGRRNIWNTVELYRRHLPGFRNVRLAESAASMGVRETRRVIGEYQLTNDDVLTSRRFTDAVFRSAGHDSHNELADGVCDVPLAALIPEGVGGLLVAGRGISAETPTAFDAVRGVVPCICSGQAAGVAATAAAASGLAPAALEVARVQERLRQQGVIL